MTRHAPVIERKLAIPRVRPGLVHRDGLLAALQAHRTEPVVVVAAPPGYGKTTLLAQWAVGDGRQVAWLTLDSQDNTPAVLMRHLAASLDRVAPGEDAMTRAFGRSLRIHETALPHLRAAVGSMPDPFLLILDDAHLIVDPTGVDILETLVDAVPHGSQVALASRDLPPIPLGRLRARGSLVEFGTSDLALDDREAAALLGDAGVSLLPADLHELRQRTEGWPAGLYLAALSISAAGSTAAVHARFNGTDRFVTDFLRSELLAHLAPDELDFLRSTSVLDEMSGPLVDHMLGTVGAAARLQALEASNRFVVPLDRDREWYRYHTLFRELLSAEMRDLEPARIGALRGRAATWYVDAGMPERGLSLAFAAGDLDQAAQIFVSIAMAVYWDGRIGALQAWIREFGLQIEAYPDVATIAALVSLLAGDEMTPLRLLPILPSDGPFASVAGVTRALLVADGVTGARAAVDRAITVARPDTRFRAQALLTASLVVEAQGDAAAAEALRAEIDSMPDELVAPPARSCTLAMRARHAMHAGDWKGAEAMCRRARSVVIANHLEDYSTTFIVSVMAARLALHHGDHRRATDELMTAQSLRPVVTAAAPIYALITRIEMARAYLALGDTEGARAMVGDADEIVRRRPDLGVLPQALERLRAQVAATPSGPAGSTTLTGAELRLLPFLATHLTFAAIAARFGLSANTIKTQAGSIYAKLEVTTRMEAVDRAQGIGLLQP